MVKLFVSENYSIQAINISNQLYTKSDFNESTA